AYTEAGVTLVALLSPRLAKEIVQIPAAEFRPSSPSFGQTLKQVAVTTATAIPEVIAYVLSSAAGPAHTQVWQVSSARDAAGFQADRLASIKLGQIRMLVRQGQCDHLDTLDALRRSLESSTFVDVGTDNVAAIVVDEITRRMVYVNLRYVRETLRDRALRDVFQEFDEKACTWRP
ncbi:MAG TPA: hypothetical protein VGD55_08735, partial [Acidothermaceae bacterium]